MIKLSEKNEIAAGSPAPSSDEEIRSFIRRAQLGDWKAFDTLFRLFLPFILATAREHGCRGVNLIKLVGRVEERMREALLRTTLFAAPDLKGYSILIRDFIREEILTAWHWSAPHLFRRAQENPVPAAISS